MKKRTSIWKVTVTAAILALLLAGCGSSDNAATTESYAADEAYMTDDIYTSEAADAEEAVEEEFADDGGSGQESAEVTESAAASERKLIKNVDCEVETETFEQLLSTIEAKTDALGGYIENSSTYNGSSYYGDTDRSADLTIRIPAENLDAFLSAVAESSNVISRNDSVTDVTLQYVDLESHKKALQTEQDRLLELMEQAESVEDIITLESRLSEVRYQIESMESQLRTYDNQVSYSTVYLYINEVKKLTPVKEQNMWEKISTGFLESLSGVGRGIFNFVVMLVIKLPYLIFWAAVIFAAVKIAKRLICHKKKKKAKKAKDEKTIEQAPGAETKEIKTEQVSGREADAAKLAQTPGDETVKIKTEAEHGSRE